MKLLRHTGDRFEFEFALEEKGLLFHLLGMYPVVPATHHRLTRKQKIPNQAENQQMLDDALQAQRKANQQEILLLVGKSGRFTDDKVNSRAVFQRAELEWLLQVLNDVRVGSWLALGSPTTPEERALQRDPQALHHLVLMEIAGGFEMFILSAVSGALKPGGEEA